MADARFPFTFVLPGGAVNNPLAGWQYEYLPFPALVEVFDNATAVGVVATFISGSQQVQEEAPVQAGGTAGVMPSRLNTEPVAWPGAQGDRLSLRYRNTTGGDITVNGVVGITALA